MSIQVWEFYTTDEGRRFQGCEFGARLNTLSPQKCCALNCKGARLEN